MDDLVVAAQQPLATRWAGHPIVLRDAIASTMDEARSAANSGAPAGHTVVADSQSSGRGRRGRVWHSPSGENLYFSMVARPALAPADAPLITLAAGLAVSDALIDFASAARVRIKWPNDVRIDGAKVAGVLVEGSVRGAQLGYAIVGIGVNVRGDSLPAELAPTATTLRIATGRLISRGDALHAILAALERRIDALASRGAAGIVAAVSERCDTLGTQVRIEGISGIARAISPRGALMLTTPDGAVHEVVAGEIAAG